MAEPGRINTATINTGSPRLPYQTPRVSARPNKSNTEGGLTKAQRETVLMVEAGSQNLRNEQITVIDGNGNIAFQSSGGQDRVDIPDSKTYLLKDAVVTHNHPGNMYENLPNRGGLAGRVGSPLSIADVVTSIRNDSKEIRARTRGGYIYSLKRPARGWNVGSLSTFQRKMRTYQMDFIRDNIASDNDLARINVVAQHVALKKIAKDYGLSYTRRKV